MFDVGFWELLLIGVIALIVLGPERLPEAARKCGFWVGRVRAYVSHMQNELEREADAADLRRDLESTRDEVNRFKQDVQADFDSDHEPDAEQTAPQETTSASSGSDATAHNGDHRS